MTVAVDFIAVEIRR